MWAVDRVLSKPPSKLKGGSDRPVTFHALGLHNLKLGKASSGTCKAGYQTVRLLSPTTLEGSTTCHEPTNADVAWNRIVTWVEGAGGFVDERLRLVDDAPCGCRGVVATSAISELDLDECPLLAVPERLYMTSEQADSLLLGRLSSTMPRMPRMLIKLPGIKDPQQQLLQRKLPVAARLAMLVAHERSAKGFSSFWWPYIATLPSRPPNAWLMTPRELDAFMDPLGPQAASWKQAVDDTRVRMEALSEHCSHGFGKQLEIDQGDIMWGLGQVLSRAFGNQQCLGLAPVIDLLNHTEGAAKPQPLELDEDEELSVYVTSSHFGQARAMQAGDELCVSYIGGSGRAAAVNAFLNFGFVPPELRYGMV